MKIAMRPIDEQKRKAYISTDKKRMAKHSNYGQVLSHTAFDREVSQ